MSMEKENKENTGAVLRHAAHVIGVSYGYVRIMAMNKDARIALATECLSEGLAFAKQRYEQRMNETAKELQAPTTV